MALVSGLACLNDPESYAGGSLMLLVGPPKPDRSKDRGQARFDTNPNCRLSMGLTTLSCKKKIILLQKQQQNAALVVYDNKGSK